ncbi:MAG: glycogen/starch/alpha-glucan family phosphorylase [Lachnospiraceae bacterium]|nr:glycogen/starch/alpha-glucan family phosphorylase [Lachnospiraceae bacterium]
MLKEKATKTYGKELKELTKEEIYFLLLDVCKEMSDEKLTTCKDGKKKLYYISAEFLIGKLLGNNLINLGIYEDVKKELAEVDVRLAEIEEIENEPSLGNGGLGRLAACFLDSIATLGLHGDGVGLNYHLGLFKQEFVKNLQKEEENPWITEKSWLRKQSDAFTVQFGDFAMKSVLYDMDVIGYNNRVNKLHLFDVEEVDEGIVTDGIEFDKSDVKRNLTLFLYPDDSTEEGRLLRVYQQYFMVSCGAQLILKEAKDRGSNLHDLADYAVVQINDTHPSMVIPELIRLLMAEGIDIKEAISIVEKTCAYTNHTILAEALEKWPMHYLETVAPAIVPIIRVLDAIKKAEYSDPSLAIIDGENRVHMANMDIHYGFSVNGVAYLHTEILKNTELKQFYDIYPDKFNNKTNGITFRRWLLHCNPELTNLLDEQIGEDYKKDAENLKKLLEKKEDAEVLDRLLTIKNQNKKVLADFLKDTQDVTISTEGIFDIQVKRLHEYKRQQLNILYAIHKYLEIKAGKKPSTPIVMIFGAKAAPAYTIAKDIIHLILCMQELIEKDEEVKPYLQIVMIENYNVTKAEVVIPACDISEQISLASKEASGTGNMKFMLNGAVTLGTEDGANVEIHELVGDDNIYIFGEQSETVIARYERGDYRSRDYYEKSPVIKAAVDFIVGDKLLEIGHKESLERLYNELLNKDWFMTFPDMEDYIAAKEKAYADYEDRTAWAKKMLVNIAKAGFFSSDRTIAEYNKDIWNL